jgi:hypothetical protein
MHLLTSNLRGLLGAALLAGLVAAGGCTTRDLPAGQCVFDTDCADGLVCADLYCRAPCDERRPCPDGMRCAPAPGTPHRICVGATEEAHCEYASDCPPTTVCTRDGRCQSECVADYDCTVVNPYLSCVRGTCDLVCGQGFANCDGDRRNGCEAELATSDAHCGVCGNTCRAGANATSRCAAGRCVTTCAAGFADCDNDPANGCEADLSEPAHCGACGRVCSGAMGLCVRDGEGARCAASCSGETPTLCGGACVNTQTNPAHCGACGTACVAGTHAEGVCTDGRCAVRCTESTRYADCDGTASNGCEAELPADPRNCGACGTVCPAGRNGQGACMAGACAVVCNTGYGDCDGERENGCETDLATTANACGMCGRACSAPANATPRCAGGVCGFTCNPGFGDCDGNAANGCEVDTGSTAAHCGACGRPCGAGLVCRAGMCVSGCPQGETNCSGACADLQRNVSHCGGCGRVCQTPANARALCTSGQCSFTCNAGFGDCDGNPSNGCETSLQNSVASCGACGQACNLPNATPVCTSGRCAVATCAAGFGNCDNDPANGCEANLNSTVSACGACGRACNLPNATAACASGACVVAQCNAGFGDCDGNPANGCETSLAGSVSHCGRCGNACPSINGTATCAMGACALACNAGFGNCDGNPANGCETNLATTASSCGMCGRACALPNATAGCASGQCTVASCAAGFGNCDNNAANGCETNLSTTVSACGACGRACSLANATPVCMGGQCAVGSCTTGFGNCDGNPANGCEVNLNTTPASCGMCGRACSLPNATAGCAGGQCTVASCTAGYGNCDNNAANGCEVNLNTTAAHCGACGRACATGQVCSNGTCSNICAAPTTFCSGQCVNTATDVSHCGGCGRMCPAFPNGTAQCASGACGGLCAAGFGNCNGLPGDGCEVNLQSTVAHCGGCGRVCAPANAAGVCVGGACGVARCNSGFGDCDGNPANGCETDLVTTVTHCGACGRACNLPNATAQCTDSTCRILRCNAGFGDCDNNPANGCETNLNTTLGSCGSCGAACSTTNVVGAACTSGQCTGTCAAGFQNCDNNLRSNGCESPLTDPYNCGSCGRSCYTANVATATCTRSVVSVGYNCNVTACTAGWANCNGVASDGCETNITNNYSNCGACAVTCDPQVRATNYPHTCQAGACLPQNDSCASATVLNLAQGPTFNIAANNLYARPGRDILAPCDSTTTRDLFFAFTLTQREIVYASTYGGASWDTVLFFASSCTTALGGTPPTGQVYCNDDINSTGCTEQTSINSSVVTAVLNPGTYYLVLASHGTSAGAANITFEHHPVGSGAVVNVPFQSGRYTGTTSGTGAISGTCGGTGPEATYWFRTCPTSGRWFFNASTCDRTTTFDTVLYHRFGTVQSCVDDSTACTINTRASTTASSTIQGAGLRLVTVDSYSSTGGTYAVNISITPWIGRRTPRRAPEACYAEGGPAERLDPRLRPRLGSAPDHGYPPSRSGHERPPARAVRAAGV